MSDLRGHSMYIATRRARLEAREAGFLVQNNLENYDSHSTVWHCGWMYVVKQCNNRVICRWLLKCHFQFAMNAWQLFASSISSLSPPCWPQTTWLINILIWISVHTLAKTCFYPFSFSLSLSLSLSFSFPFFFFPFFLFLFFPLPIFPFFIFRLFIFFCFQGFFLCTSYFLSLFISNQFFFSFSFSFLFLFSFFSFSFFFTLPIFHFSIFRLFIFFCFQGFFYVLTSYFLSLFISNQLLGRLDGT